MLIALKNFLENSFFVKELTITLVICSILFFWVVGLGSIGRTLQFHPVGIAYSGFFSVSAQFATAYEYVHRPKSNNKGNEPILKKTLCKKRNYENWYAKVDLNRCYFSVQSHHAYRFCNALLFGNTCIGIVLPERYYKIHSFWERYLFGLKNPCAALESDRFNYEVAANDKSSLSSTLSRAYRSLGCVYKRPIRYNMFILVSEINDKVFDIPHTLITAKISNDFKPKKLLYYSRHLNFIFDVSFLLWFI